MATLRRLAIESCGGGGHFFVVEAEGAVFHGSVLAAEGAEGPEVVGNGH
jgi:hypothetical protein